MTFEEKLNNLEKYSKMLSLANAKQTYGHKGKSNSAKYGNGSLVEKEIFANIKERVGR